MDYIVTQPTLSVTKQIFQMSGNSSYFEDLSDSFIIESAKLEDAISSLSPLSEKLPLDEIVALYHRIMNVNSLIQVLKQSISNNEQKDQRLLEKIKAAESLINDSFNEKFHPLILSQLNSSIQESMTSLKSSKKKERTKQVIEEEAKYYEKLRQTMSTKEFVEQYDKMIKND